MEGSLFSMEGNFLTLEPDLYDSDSDDVPDPGLLEEKELSFSKLAPHLFMRGAWRKTSTPKARARQLWRLLRRSRHSFLEKEKKSQMRVARLTHGLEPLRRLQVAAGLCSVAQDPVGRRFVVLDGAGCLHLHQQDGWGLGTLQAPVALTGLAAVPGPLGSVSRFVGWGPAGLALLKPDLSPLWLSGPSAGRPLRRRRQPACCLPVPALGLLLVAEAGGGLALWKFRLGGRRLSPCGPSLQPQPSSKAALTRLALGPLSPDAAPHCFAAYGSAVLTLDLQAWTVTDVRQDLHKTTISDLVYCGEMEAMVTASRDSTVKVWGADWQIRMVFVGHTGPVTALAVLPGTTLVLSASQDGTLRTWDLQAVAQVGEVVLNCWDQGARPESVHCLLAPAGPGWPVLSLRAGSVELWSLRELYSLLAQLSAPILHLHVAPELPLSTHLPARLVCACADGSVYLVNPNTGRTVTALLLGPEDRAAAVAYCLPREVLWLLTRAGHLVRANTLCSPMRVLLRVGPRPHPAPRPCCLHLYSHLTDPGSAFTSWEMVCQHRGELGRNVQTWKDKNRYLPVVGHTDGTLSVLNWQTSERAFHTEAHSPGPVTAIASTWSSIVSSGADLTVKIWRVFPYSEESLSLLRTFSCCHPALALCALGRTLMVAFEDPDSATYGLVHFDLQHSQRFDHRPQDDHLDHITGLCCCPTLKLYASSSLDCTIRIWTSDNHLLRLLQLNGAPQALTFSSNNGDLVLALGSRLCLVSHKLYLPTTYLVKNLCQEAPDMLDDPPLPLTLTSLQSLTSVRLQRPTSLHPASSFWTAGEPAEPARSCPGPSSASSSIERGPAVPQQPLLKEDLQPILARDKDLQELRWGRVVPAARAPLSWPQQLEAFDNYLHLIYGPSLLGLRPRTDSQQWTRAAAVEDRSEGLPSAIPSLVKAGVCVDSPRTLPPRDWGALSLGIAHPPHGVSPIPPAHKQVHSRASQLLARSSLSSYLGLSMDLQLQSERLLEERPQAPKPLSRLRKERVPLLEERRPKELLSNLRGFFPAAIEHLKNLPRPVNFPGWIPNSAVLQQLWLPQEPEGSQEDLWLLRARRVLTRSQIRRSGEEWDEDLDLDWSLDWSLDYQHPSPEGSPERSPELAPEKPPASWLNLLRQRFQGLIRRRARDSVSRTQTFLRRHRYQRGHSLWELRYGHVPRFLRFFVIQNWFKKLFPLFTLEAYPELGTVDGLAQGFMDLLKEVSWEDRVHILRALQRLLPDMSKSLYKKLQGIIKYLLNMDQPPNLQETTQKHFVMLALQLQLACSLESREVVLELMSYLLYSPASCRAELQKLLDGLGLQDPEGVLFREMMTWVPDLDLHCKAMLRRCCSEKLEEMIHVLEVEDLQPSVARLSDVLPKVSETALSQVSEPLAHLSVPPSPARSSTLSVSWTPSQLVLRRGQGPAAPEPQARPRRSRRTLSESLVPFCTVPDIYVRSSAPDALLERPLPLEQTEWSRSKILDLGPIDALNLFCELKRRSYLQEEAWALRPPRVPPNAVAPQPRHHVLDPILRLQETKHGRSRMRLRGQLLARHREGLAFDGSIRTLKLPLPRVELRPFPLDWPRPARPLPPLLLQPPLRRYFLPDLADPDFFD
uniref:WD repeat domain 97 n=1 Tax=Pipistrellus kuhlii TaxID=59472 RepID=A0A7J7RLR2_PIPKU|nr:WD repeat domain 97 [Pipistrellus kuhlii]